MSRHIYLTNIPLSTATAQLDEVLRRLGKADPLPAEDIPLRLAVGRITAAAVFAARTSPHYHASAMDGYAVSSSSTLGATETHPINLTVPEQAVPVNTGDALPAGTDAVIMIEHVQEVEAERTISVSSAVTPYQNVRVTGEDMVATEMVLPANHRLRPVDLGALAGCGWTQVSVRRQAQVVIIPTGSELISVDDAAVQELPPGAIIEYNSLILAAQIEAADGLVTTLPIVPDDQTALLAALDAAVAQQPDLVLVLSGSSAGTRDFTSSIIEQRGELLVHGIAVRPGHPVIMGIVAATPVIGVPGYPVSAALTGELIIEPLLARWQGVPSALSLRPRVDAIMTRKLTSPPGDDDFVRVTLAQVGDRLLATPLARGAGVITSLVRADGLAHIPRFSEGVDAGTAVPVILYRERFQLERTILICGSHDPAVDLLGGLLAERYPGDRLTSAHVGSMGGLIALKKREAHLAGSHLLDESTGDYNRSFVRKYLADVPLRLITFAHREQGFYVQPGNPLNVRSFEDLTRLRFVNRQRGAGTRVLLDYELARRGIAAGAVQGYEREEYTHLAIAVAVKSGAADCGMGVRSGAVALGLEFIPIGWERYDLVIPDEYAAHPVMLHLLEVLRSEEFRSILAAQPGYGVHETGHEITP